MKWNCVVGEEHCANRSASRQIARGYMGITKFATVGATTVVLYMLECISLDIDIM